VISFFSDQYEMGDEKKEDHAGVVSPVQTDVSAGTGDAGPITVEFLRQSIEMLNI